MGDHIYNKSNGALGKLDKSEIAEVMRELAVPEHSIENVLQRMEVDELDWKGFRALLEPPTQPWVTSLGPVPVPNLGVVKDVPGVGSVACVVEDSAKVTYRRTVRAASSHLANHSEEELKATFQELDADGDGKLSRKELTMGLRKLGMSERQIK